ncbi:MAG: Nif3-like dinuclear metal center hexameric protein [Rikenellaceae bacterium]|nr:Nif3-like dinuclear metal center hexameric protein [Rikenellaceae bacterium]
MDFTVKDVVCALEDFAPAELQQGYDNSGLTVGHYGNKVSKVLLCVDIDYDIMDEAEEIGADMIVSHHPLIFHPIKRLNGIGYIQRIVERAIKKGIALYACHTNLDAVNGGMSHRLAEKLGLTDTEVLEVFDGQEIKEKWELAGFGVTGNLAAPMEPAAFLAFLKERLSLEVIRHSRLCKPSVGRIALCTGAGASLAGKAVRAGADIYIASDFKYNDFIEADGRIIVADIGHFESEYCAIDLLYDIITKKIPTFAVRKSERSLNPVKYYI